LWAALPEQERITPSRETSAEAIQPELALGDIARRWETVGRRAEAAAVRAREHAWRALREMETNRLRQAYERQSDS
jgi:hypothetical protein